MIKEAEETVKAFKSALEERKTLIETIIETGKGLSIKFAVNILSKVYQIITLLLKVGRQIWDSSGIKLFENSTLKELILERKKIALVKTYYEYVLFCKKEKGAWPKASRKFIVQDILKNNPHFAHM